MLLARAALGLGQAAADAYRAWRRIHVLDDIDFTAFRILPLLVDTVERFGIDEPELARIRGASKHTWLKNMGRLRLLLATLKVLDEAAIGTVVIKGAALLARYPHLAAMRGTGDFDILIERRDARRALSQLLDAGFAVDGIRVDAFTDADLGLLHGLHFGRGDPSETVDVHWWPLPDWTDEAYVTALFARGETHRLAGTAVTVPSLDDHLFLATARAQPDDPDELLLRAIETTLLLRGCDGRLDWARFVATCTANCSAARAGALLSLVATELQAPLLPAVLHDLGVAAAVEGRPQAPSLWSAVRAFWNDQTARIASDLDTVTYPAGFSFPETQGRWTDGRFAAFAVPIGPTGEIGVQVQFDARPFLPPGITRFAFEVYAGRGDPKQIVLTTDDPFPSRIIVDAVAQGDPIAVALVAFELMDTRSPKSIRHSSDPRRLGLLVDRPTWL